MTSRRPGRKRKLNAVRRQPRAAARDNGTPELQVKRALLSNQCDPPQFSVDVPLDVLLARGMIDREQHIVGMSFAVLSWRLFGGCPVAGCEQLYQRMVAEGASGDFGPRRENEDTRSDDDKARYERMVDVLKPTASRLVLDAVRRVACYLEVPAMLARVVQREAATAHEMGAWALIVLGLDRLVLLRNRDKGR